MRRARFAKSGQPYYARAAQSLLPQFQGYRCWSWGESIVADGIGADLYIKLKSFQNDLAGSAALGCQVLVCDVCSIVVWRKRQRKLWLEEKVGRTGGPHLSGVPWASQPHKLDKLEPRVEDGRFVEQGRQDQLVSLNMGIAHAVFLSLRFLNLAPVKNMVLGFPSLSRASTDISARSYVAQSVFTGPIFDFALYCT